MTYNSSFQDRAGQAAEAKKKALEQLRARPPVDEQRAAERLAAGQQRAATPAAKAAAAAPKSEAEKKAARDAKYAKRKGRK